jgi:hypothetical protein
MDRNRICHMTNHYYRLRKDLLRKVNTMLFNNNKEKITRNRPLNNYGSILSNSFILVLFVTKLLYT